MNWICLLMTTVVMAVMLGLAHKPLGDYIATTLESDRDTKVESWMHRIIGVDSSKEQSWSAYARSVLAFSLMGVLLLYLLQRIQQWLPFSLGDGPVAPQVAFNTAISFVTNTNWQAYSPETTLGYTVQFAGLVVQNLVSAATGIAVAVALVRGLARRHCATIGNFWVDLVRITGRVLLPGAAIGAIVLMAGGVVQNLEGFRTVTTLAGHVQTIPGGPVASQEAIKELGTNGGGFYNANSSHPFENPQAWTSFFETFLILVIPFSLPRTFGTMVGDRRQGMAILKAMATLFLLTLAATAAFEFTGSGTASRLAGSAMEGKEQRFGLVQSVFFANATTSTSTGAVNSMHDSYTALGGMVPLLTMMLGEVSPGGVGTGLYGMLVIAVIAVFIAGLLVGRTPEYLGKKIGPAQMKIASLYLSLIHI